MLYLCCIAFLSVSVILVNSTRFINYADSYANTLGMYRQLYNHNKRVNKIDLTIGICLINSVLTSYIYVKKVCEASPITNL